MSEYLVRGALLTCDFGSHARKLNLPLSHGIYIKEKAQILEDDCIVDDNISYFGVCTCETPPCDTETVTLQKYGDAGKDGATITGCKCCPEIIGKWRDCMERNMYAGNVKTVTTESYLVCKHGGLIQPVSSGQEEEE